jgi:hypothetical protein
MEVWLIGRLGEHLETASTQAESCSQALPVMAFRGARIDAWMTLGAAG